MVAASPQQTFHHLSFADDGGLILLQFYQPMTANIYFLIAVAELILHYETMEPMSFWSSNKW